MILNSFLKILLFSETNLTLSFKRILMGNLFQKIEALRKSPVGEKVKQRLKDFEAFEAKPSKQWFSELCFCLLTANSKAESALRIQAQLGAEGFCKASASDVKKCIRANKHRFHNNKTAFIIEARKFLDIKNIITKLVEDQGGQEAREWLTQNVKGLGYKEASHFLRNVGYKNLAILDRHILNLMLEHGFLKEKPRSLSKSRYLEIEKSFNSIASKLGMPPAELDLFMWFMKTGEVLK